MQFLRTAFALVVLNLVLLVAIIASGHFVSYLIGMV